MSVSRRNGPSTITTLSDLQGTPKEGVVLGGFHGVKAPDAQLEEKAKAHADDSKAEEKSGLDIHGNVQKSVVAKDFHAKKKVGFGQMSAAETTAHGDIKKTVHAEVYSNKAVCIGGNVGSSVVAETATLDDDLNFG